MIDPGLFLAFVLASTLLMLIPGPNVALIVANSVSHGTRFGLLTVAGTASAMMLQLSLTTLGLAAVLAVLGAWLEWLRWIGVAYLLGLGVSHWLAPAVTPGVTQALPRPARQIFMRGFLVSLTNPKTLLFYGAFFPQFLEPGVDMQRQVLLLSATFIGLAVALDSMWAILAGRVRGLLIGRGRLHHRLSGALLIGAGMGLALARRR